ncbi:Mannosyltransferase 1, CMT1 [Ascosphaera apis ARSEF 7405]|uniref:Mannosyltransferase 1, CMT1 n=1 Tax=Ascosphaera apis ARSEF 7405 TaxID=392613 RepID=A0A166NT86_9EURO|nr:Mannosyltransferase 1, CMT1 [Ascosphaera apis ARSEF 7405]
MSRRLLHPDEYELVSRSSIDSKDTFDLDDDDFEAQATPTTSTFLRERPSLFRRAVARLPLIGSHISRLRQHRSSPVWRASRTVKPFSLTYRSVTHVLHWTLVAVVVLVVATALIRPSYTHLPAHYVARRETAYASTVPGRGNTNNETVFIAASLYDPTGAVVGGSWGQSILQLIDLIGDDKAFLSIYENNSGEAGHSALKEFEKKLKCRNSITYEATMDAKGVQQITLPDGTKRVKRIAYLAEVRNRALRILDTDTSLPKFDRLLYVNDIVFDPVDALQLLFSTNVDADGVAQYRAACATDFINAFKFYDTFATRDLEGYSMGNAQSRQDVLDQKDAVRVRSCWGGMVAFDASYFQTKTSPARFRAEDDAFWDASECCLIHADIQKAPDNSDSADLQDMDTGIYMNPYVRVAYDDSVLSWLSFTRRFERLYSPIQILVSRIAGLPRFNPRRTERVGEKVKDMVFVANANSTSKHSGSWKPIDRIAGTGGFCGRRGAQVMIEHPKKGHKNWEPLEIPPGAP